MAGGRLFAIAKRAARSLANRDLRRGLNGWMAMVLQRALALAQLRAAAATFQHRGCRAALNTLLAQQAARHAALAKAGEPVRTAGGCAGDIS